jgi:hypothetical protein
MTLWRSDGVTSRHVWNASAIVDGKCQGIPRISVVNAEKVTAVIAKAKDMNLEKGSARWKNVDKFDLAQGMWGITLE